MDVTRRDDPATIRSAVATRYSAIGRQPDGEETIPTGRGWAERLGYPAELLDRAPTSALASFTGIGAPITAAQPAVGQDVLDLGCGAGLDSILLGGMVAPSGHVYGVDLASGMVATARAGVAEVGVTNVSIQQAAAEELPLGDQSVDVVVVNGLFNLAPDKRAVLSEVARVLRPGGRLVGAEIAVTDERQPQEFDPEAWFR